MNFFPIRIKAKSLKTQFYMIYSQQKVNNPVNFAESC